MEYTLSVITVVTLIGLVACVFDVRTRRIPNVLTLGAAAVGVAYHGATGGLYGVLDSVGGWTVGALLFAPAMWSALAMKTASIPAAAAPAMSVLTPSPRHRIFVRPGAAPFFSAMHASARS